MVGASEAAYLRALDPASCRSVLAQVATKELACFIVAGVDEVPAPLAAVAESTKTALFRSPLPSVELMWMLRPYLARALAESTTTHGVLLDVLGMGVLITGDSGVGKSELALELISRGSGLVADDVVELYRIGPETVEGRCPDAAHGFPGGARAGRAQHPHHLRRGGAAPAQEPEADRAPGAARGTGVAAAGAPAAQARAPSRSWASRSAR